MTVHIMVCIKSVLKTALQGSAKRTPDNSELNPFDRPALEAAIRIKEATGGRVTVLSMGPEASAQALAEAQAMGADKAVLINDRALAESDTLVTARVLASAIDRIGSFDFVFFGTRSADSDTGQVGPQTACLLDIPFLSGIKKIALQDDNWEIQRTMDAWEEIWQVQSPAAATIAPHAFRPRPVGLVGISQVYDQPSLQRMTLADLNLAAKAVGLAGSPTRVAALQKIKRDRTCDMLEGAPREQVDALIERLIKSGQME
jgi:electron transfer flavoprotein beta subunit